MTIKKLFLILVLYLTILIITYITHIKLFYVDVVFYSAIIDVVIATVITSILIIFFNNFKIYNKTEYILLVIIFLLSGYSIAITIPTLIDRSLSFYILEKIEQRGGGIKISGFDRIFKEEYIVEHHLMEVRLTEQLESGTIIIKNQCVEITSKGKLLANFSQNFRKYFLPKKRLLLNEYSDSLTEIFKNKSSKDSGILGYEC